MTYFASAVLVCAIGHCAECAIKRKAGYFVPVPWSWIALAPWAAVLLVG